MSDTVLSDRQSGVAVLTLNRPDKLNAFIDEMIARLADLLRECERDPEVRAVLLTGAGRAFSAGQDLASVQDRQDAGAGGMHFRAHLEAGYNPIILRLRSMEKPVVAAVNGIAAGAGASLALACDLRIAGQSTAFMQAFSKVGLVPDSGSTWFLTRQLGFARAYEMAVTGRKVGADEALALGLVNEVVANDDVLARATELAASLASGPTRAFGLTKRAMNRALSTSLEDALAYEAMLQDVAGTTSDHREGVAAFLEKRAPRFRGQ